MARTKIGGGRKRKVAAEAAAGASLEHSSKKHRSSEQSQDAGQAPALASKARSRFENPQVSSQDPQSHHFADGAKLQQPRQVGPRGGTPSPTSRGDSSNYSDSAVKYQVGSKFEPEGRPGVSDPARWKKKKMKAAKFIHSASGLGSTWIGKRPLGEGSFGITGLWEKYDADGEMTDVSL